MAARVPELQVVVRIKVFADRIEPALIQQACPVRDVLQCATVTSFAYFMPFTLLISLP